MTMSRADTVEWPVAELLYYCSSIVNGSDNRLVSRGDNRPFAQLWRCRELLLQSIKLSSFFLGGENERGGLTLHNNRNIKFNLACTGCTIGHWS